MVVNQHTISLSGIFKDKSILEALHLIKEQVGKEVSLNRVELQLQYVYREVQDEANLKVYDEPLVVQKDLEEFQRIKAKLERQGVNVADLC